MSSPPYKRKQNARMMATQFKATHEDNNNSLKTKERLNAHTFVLWFQRMMDYERQNFSLYLSEEVVLEWFGRTVRSRKKVSAFIKYDMQCTRHDFSTIECIDKIITRQDNVSRNSETDVTSKLACPLSPEMIKNKKNLVSNKRKRPGLRSRCISPEWEKNCQPESDSEESSRKRMKRNNCDVVSEKGNGDSDLPNWEGDGQIQDKMNRPVSTKLKRKCVLVTPPNLELGQGDCLPSTSSDSEMSHAALNAQLPKKAVSCTGYVEFTRSKNNSSVDSVKWERKCKLQISYSEDPLNVGEYIIWGLYYTDESKCRRNLLAAFEEIAID